MKMFTLLHTPGHPHPHSCNLLPQDDLMPWLGSAVHMVWELQMTSKKTPQFATNLFESRSNLLTAL